MADAERLAPRPRVAYLMNPSRRSSESIAIEANVVDAAARTLTSSRIHISQARIELIEKVSDSVRPDWPFAIPGFIDAHIHIESSMLVPSEFARIAVCHGTVATVSDPHEIGNVLGVAGVDWMIDNAGRVPLKFFFGAPSCVPATAFESAGATIDAEQIGRLLDRDEIHYLAEMMNYLGVLAGDKDVAAKLRVARQVGKPVDGHAPGLAGDEAVRYIQAGITTDHECVTHEEALHKLVHGMKILIREGSAAKNFESLRPLIDRFPNRVMLCSDDKHPDDLVIGHINQLVSRAVREGTDPFNAILAACINPIEHYALPVGRLRVGDQADFVLVEDLRDFKVVSTFIDGDRVFDGERTSIESVPCQRVNRFDCREKVAGDFVIRSRSSGQSETTVRVIEARDGSLVTGQSEAALRVVGGRIESDVSSDVLKFAVVNRYREAAPAIAFIRGFGLRRGAIASSVGHDSHNILAVGSDDESLCRVVNAVIAQHGGIAAGSQGDAHVLPLPIAGIMTDRPATEVADAYQQIDRFAKQTLGSTLSAPLMTLSFMALLVIPELKLSDLGLFDVGRFGFVRVEL